MDGIVIDLGDEFTVEKDPDGYLAIRIQNAAFVEEPRWLRINVFGGDRDRYLEKLIWALQDLRDRS